MTGYRVPYVAPDILAESAEGAFHRAGGLTAEGMASYLGTKPRYTTNVLIAATQLKILQEDKGVYRVTTEGVDLAKADKAQRPVVFKSFLVRFDPFVIFAMLAMKGNTLQEAVRKVRVIYDILEDERYILDSFRSWGTYTEVLKKGNDGNYEVGITEEKLTEQYLHDLIQAIQSEWTARLFISSKVREYAYAYLGEDEKTDLVAALMKFGDESEDALRELGKSFETFLRRLAADKNVQNLSQANGISEIANLLKGNKVILEQHRKLSETIGVYRNAGDHGIDKVTMKPWRIESDASLEAILLALTTIRSIYTYTEKGEQII